VTAKPVFDTAATGGHDAHLAVPMFFADQAPARAGSSDRVAMLEAFGQRFPGLSLRDTGNLFDSGGTSKQGGMLLT
jgi:hypothetical protein